MAPPPGRPPRSGAADDAECAEFAQGLRALRGSARLTLAELSRKTSYSISALSDATSGKRGRLPSWDLTAAYVLACEGNVDEWREKWEATTGRKANRVIDLVITPEMEHRAAFNVTRSRKRRSFSASVMAAVIAAMCAVLAALVPILMESSAGAGPKTPTPTSTITWSNGTGSRLYTEVADNRLGTDVFTDPEGEVPTRAPAQIPFGETVEVACWAPNESGMGSINAFYLVKTAPWIGEWAPANTFLNANASGASEIDPDVPKCESGVSTGTY